MSGTNKKILTFKWPDEMKNPRFKLGDEVEFCNSNQVLTGWLRGEEIVYAHKGTRGTVEGFSVLTVPKLYVMYQVHFEAPPGVDCKGFTTGLEPKYLQSTYKGLFVCENCQYGGHSLDEECDESDMAKNTRGECKGFQRKL